VTRPATDSPLWTSVIAGVPLPPGARRIGRENPGRADELAAQWSPATPAEARRAMDAAAAAFPGWAATPRAERLAALHTLLAAVESRTDEFAGLITRENGKPARDARAEIAAGLADARFALAEAGRDGGTEPAPATGTGGRGELRLEPVGGYLLVTPWNFPLATVLRKLIPALAYGNTAVVKPSELTPGPAARLFSLAAESGLPPGAASLVLGFGAEVGAALTEHPALRGISFTGSTATGLALARATAGRDVRLQLEMGGKNSLVVLADADLDAAVAAAITGGFSCAGQWCTGTGRVIVEQPLHDAFVARLAARAAALRVGPGDDPATEVGPVATAARVQAAREAVAAITGAGGHLRCGGATPPGGHFFTPAVLAGVVETMPAFVDELFVPVLPVASAQDADDAVRLANTGRYGLSASVFAGDPRRAAEVAVRLEAGIVHANLHTAYREPAFPVSGWRDSGRGLPECGRFVRDFFSRPRAVYIAE
jgi:aldehyde dehydrogenase (NAD+)